MIWVYISGTYQWTARPSRWGCVWHHFYWDLIAILVPYYKTTKRRFKNPGKYRADTILVFSTTTYKHALPINLQLRKKNQSMCHLHTKKKNFFWWKYKKKEELVLTAIINNNINAMNFVHIPHNNCSIWPQICQNYFTSLLHLLKKFAIWLGAIVRVTY